MKLVALPLHGLRPLLVAALALHFAPAARAATSTWSNNASGNFTNSANWFLSVGPPGAADDAVFTNNTKFQVTWTSSITNKNAFFNGRGGAVTQAIGTSFWLLTNTYVVGQNPGTTATVTHVSGTLRVTNSAGTAQMIIGQGGDGTFDLNGGAVVADRLLVTNNSSSVTNSTFNLNAGNLTTLHGSVITQATGFAIGTVLNQTATWTMTGGTNALNIASGNVSVGDLAGAAGIVTVDGASTLWAVNQPLQVGRLGRGQLFITNGGRVASDTGIIGVNFLSNANLARISGSNSAWLIDGPLTVGGLGLSNQMLIEAGGTVSNTSGIIGSGAGASSNVVTVTGAGSLWTNTGNLIVGSSGSSNLLLVSGGAVHAPNLFISSLGVATNNLVQVSGGALTVANGSGTGQLNIGSTGHGRFELNGGTVTADRLLVTNTSVATTRSLLVLNNGTLTVRSNSTIVLPSGGVFLLGTNAGSSITLNLQGGLHTVSNVFGPVAVGLGTTVANSTGIVNVAGANALWPINTNLLMGAGGGTGVLTISNGAQVIAQKLLAGLGLFGGNAFITASGAGSTLTLSNTTGATSFFSQESSGNRYTFDSGARLEANHRLELGSNINSFNNFLVLSGSGTVLTNVGATNIPLIVGTAGSGNTFAVSNGAAAYLSALTIGQSGSSNRLTIGTNGTVASATSVVFGQNAGALANLLDMTGGNLIGSGANGALSQLVIGQGGGGQFAFNGGLVVTEHLFVTNNGALFTNSTFNFNFGTLTTLSNSTVISPSSFIIGNTPGQTATWQMLGGSNFISAPAGGTFLGTGAGGAGRVIVDGPATIWSNSSNLTVGNPGSGSLVLVTNGASVTAAGLTVGLGAGANNNLVTITGSNSVLRIGTTGSAAVGQIGAVNQLTIANGGTFINPGVATIGAASGTFSNSVLVTGAGSTWSNGGLIRLGAQGDGNRLTVSNGGTVFSDSALIGVGATGSNSVAVVNGANSLWTNAGALTLGLVSPGNQLLVTNNSRLVSTGGTLGDTASSSNNVAKIAGLSAVWSTGSGALTVGNFGSGNQLTLTVGGTLTSSGATIGAFSGAANNLVVLDDPQAKWTNTGALLVGAGGSGNQLILSNGGTVQTDSLVISSAIGGSNNVVTLANGSLLGGQFPIPMTSLNIGAAGRGQLDFNGGTIITRTLIVTNNGPGFTNSVFNFNFGMLTTVSNVSIVAPGTGNFAIGRTAGQTGTWNALGGDNTVIGAVDLGNAAGRTGNLIVSGASTVWSNTGGIRVGFSGHDSQLIVSNGAALFSPGGITVGAGSSSAISNLFVAHGSGSRVTTSGLDVGLFGTNNRAIIAAGAAVITDLASIGLASSARSNSVLVTGPGTLWTNANNLSIGPGADNQLTVADGARLFIGGAANVGSAATASNNAVLVTGSGSLWSNVGSLVFGGTGSGNSLTVASNGVVTADSFLVGASAGALNNVITVDGGELRGNGSNGSGAVLTVGRDGDGKVNLLSGSITASALRLTNGVSSRFEFAGGTLNVLNSTVNNGTSFVVGNGTNAATLNLLGSNTHTFANNLTLNSNATLTGNGRIFGTVSSTAATIRPGSSAGALEIDGSLLFGSAATVVFELGGLIPTNQYDQISVTNFVNYAGTLSLALINNFLPDDSDTFTLFKTGTSNGEFDNAPFGGRVNLANNLASFAVTYSGTNVVLGDAKYVDTDGDGQVDLFEQAAGTNPNDSASYLEITSITKGASDHTFVQFLSVIAKSYTVEFSGDLVTWNTAAGATFTTPFAGTSQFEDDGTLTGGVAATKRFYRIRLAP